MNRSLWSIAAWAMFVAALTLGHAQAAEPKAADKPAGAAKPAKEEPKGDKAKAAAIKANKAAAELEALAAPFAEALTGKLELKAAEAVEDAQLKQWIPQFTEQFRPILTAELNFIRQVCELTPEQRPKIKAAGTAAVTEAARKMAELQVRARRGVGVNKQPEPRQIIHDALAKVLEETLTTEQMADYAAEATKRTALRKRAAIHSVVARLDALMCLTTAQRDQIIESISTNWQRKWEQWLAMSVYGDQYFPSIPDAYVVKFLSTDQKAVWGGLQKIEINHWGHDGQAQENDGWWGDDPAEANAPRDAVRVFLEE